MVKWYCYHINSSLRREFIINLCCYKTIWNETKENLKGLQKFWQLFCVLIGLALRSSHFDYDRLYKKPKEMSKCINEYFH